MTYHDQIDRRLRAADRLPQGIEHTARLQAVLDDLAVRIIAANPVTGPSMARSSRFRNWRLSVARRGALLASAIGVLLVGTAAAATTILTTHTGEYNKGWETQAGGPGENLLMGAPNFCQAALKLSSDITYPAGYSAWRPWVLIAETGQPKVTSTGDCGSNSSGGEGKPTLVSTGALDGWFAMSAFCAWTYAWRDAEGSGDVAGATHAASVIAGALQWPAVVAEDPHPTDHVPIGGTTTTGLFGWFIPIQNAVRRGDVARVQALTTAWVSQCTEFEPPADSDGGTVNPLDKSLGAS